MSYHLDIDSIKESFNFEKGIKHNPTKRTRLLPYTTKFNEAKYNFTAVIGEFIRLVGRKKLSESINVEELLEKVLNEIMFEDISQRTECKQLLKTLFLNDNQQLHLFHPQVLFYIDSLDLENKRLATFLYQVLWGNHNVLVEELVQSKPQDVMTSLLFDALPPLSELDNEPQKYDVYLSSISELFMIDFKWLIKKPQLFILHIEKILSYYYFFYVTQFAIISEAMFHAENQILTPIYFNLEWERLSQTRTSYEKGWKRIEELVSRVFSHINCLEFLNHTTNSSGDLYSYQKIGELIREMSPQQQSELEMQLDQIMDEYKNKLEHDSKWEQLGNIRAPHENPVLSKIYLFYKVIDHQFNKSSRNKPYQEYQKWFVHFCQNSFLKSSGRLGKTLNLNADYLLFFTKLIIKDDEKIRLKRLFDEFELRGIAFDRDTQSAIVEYFEAINILEKKSDSGDALYVKAFL